MFPAIPIVSESLANRDIAISELESEPPGESVYAPSCVSDSRIKDRSDCVHWLRLP